MTYSANIVIKAALIAILVVGIVTYTYLQSRNFLQGPVLSIEFPAHGDVFTQSLIEVRGRAEHVTNISLNGRPISIDESGLFREQLLLAYGYNIITLEAHDRFNRGTSRELELMYIE